MSLTARSPREQQAVEQLAVTTFSPGVAITLVMAFLVLIVVVPVYETTQDTMARIQARERLMQQGVPRKEWPQRRPRIADLLGELPLPNPAALRALEDDLLLTSAAGKQLRPMTQSLLTTLGVGNRSVVFGRHGWLHYIDGVDYVIGPGFLEPEHSARARENGRTSDARPAILQLHRELNALGVELVVLPIPDKAVIMPGTLARDLEGTGSLQNRSWQTFADDLRRSGVHLLDVTGPMADAQASGRMQFLQADSHWTPAGIDITARAVASLLIRDLGIPPGPTNHYARRPEPFERNTADLVELLSLPASHARRLAHQWITLDHIVDPDGQLWQSIPGSDVLLIGDSFSEFWSSDRNGPAQGAGLAEQISYYLQRPIERRASHTFGRFDVREELGQSLDEVRRTATGRRIIIYEFAVRKLSVGDWPLLPP